MHISKVKTAFKIADVEYVKDSTKLNFNYLKDLKDENNQSLSQNILTQNVVRVYLIVVDGEVKKIGGSQADGGIKSTLNIYKDGGVKGRPSIRSFGVWYFLYHTILTGAKIEFYMIYQPNFETQVKGLFGFCAIKDASISYNYAITKKRYKPLKLASVFFRFLAFCVSQIKFLKERLNYSYFFVWLSSAFKPHK
ncbi:hypothetical protein HpBGD49_15640 [Helicobacter pylori]